MKKLISNKNGKVAMFIAESQDDWECLCLLYNEGIIFGAYELFNVKEDNYNQALKLWLNKHFPNCYGALQISIVRDFASKPENKLLRG